MVSMVTDRRESDIQEEPTTEEEEQKVDGMLNTIGSWLFEGLKILLVFFYVERLFFGVYIFYSVSDSVSITRNY